MKEDKEEKKRVVLGMSGGVDSAAAALILMQEGFEVIGVTCLFLACDESYAAARDAAAVCAHLGIPHVARECTLEFEQTVVVPFVEEYASGRTPNPCVRCNALCKLPSLMQEADEQGCFYVATGHYARIAQKTDTDRLVVKTALDLTKDQSYMLSRLTQEQLSRLIFPLGTLTKAEIRVRAKEAGLCVSQKPESQDICFIKDDYIAFLGTRGVEAKPGSIVEGKGKEVGRPEGLFRYTMGQRKGIGVAAEKPYYVIGKNSQKNELIVGFEEDTVLSSVDVSQVVWQAFSSPDTPIECEVKLRYRANAVPCVVEPLSAGSGDLGEKSQEDRQKVRVCLRTPQPITAPGQYAVFYQGETVVGCGVIESVSREGRV